MSKKERKKATPLVPSSELYLTLPLLVSQYIMHIPYLSIFLSSLCVAGGRFKYDEEAWAWFSFIPPSMSLPFQFVDQMLMCVCVELCFKFKWLTSDRYRPKILSRKCLILVQNVSQEIWILLSIVNFRFRPQYRKENTPNFIGTKYYLASPCAFFRLIELFLFVCLLQFFYSNNPVIFLGRATVEIRSRLHQTLLRRPQRPLRLWRLLS
jgi:hypothetical protein